MTVCAGLTLEQRLLATESPGLSASRHPAQGIKTLTTETRLDWNAFAEPPGLPLRDGADSWLRGDVDGLPRRLSLPLCY